MAKAAVVQRVFVFGAIDITFADFFHVNAERGEIHRDMPKGRSLRCVLFLLCLSAVLFALLLIRAVAGACHSTVGTVAAAGGFAFLFILDKIVYNKCHDNGNHKAYYNGCNIL